jgi:hypothetical protein
VAGDRPVISLGRSPLRLLLTCSGDGLTLEARLGTRSPSILSTGQLFGGSRSLGHTSSLGGGKLKIFKKEHLVA